MCSSLRKWFQSANFYVYLSHFLSAWGDRMWAFGVGLFLVNIASHDLQLPAIYGLSNSLTIFFLGAVIGDWIDNTARLKAAVLSLLLQNIFVVICAGGVYAFLWFDYEIRSGERSLWLLPLCQGLIIFLAILSSLASVARHIAVERDWIVEICGKDKDMLATMTASLRRIDQATLILAPIATGQIMTFAGLKNGAVFIGAWNVMSLFLEYFFLHKVYSTVPALRAKKALSRAEAKNFPAEGQANADEGLTAGKEEETPNDELSSVAVAGNITEGTSNQPEKEASITVEGEKEIGDSAVDPKEVTNEQKENPKQPDSVSKPKENKKFEKFLSRILVLYRGWHTYLGYNVALAGIALACLYMTVLGFDNITVAYATTQGVSESVLGILMGASAVFGILGTFGYPALRQRVGLVRTGIIALSSQITCLVLCVVSIWMPGSPFDPLYYIHPPSDIPMCSNITNDHKDMPTVSDNSTDSYYIQRPSTVTPMVVANMTNSSSTDCMISTLNSEPDSYLSVGLLISGIVLSRFGLWVADLTITQLFLEVVAEKERGIVSGVQSSLNQIMNVIKFILVVAFPDIPTFGYLIIISFLFICLGWLFYAIFVRRTRGHFFHFGKCKCGNGYSVNGNVNVNPPPVQVVQQGHAPSA